MQKMPDYIQATYEGENKSDYALKAKIALDGVATHPEEAEYAYAYAANFYAIAKHYDKSIELCHKILPTLTIWDCKCDTLNTLINALTASGQLKEAMEVRLQLEDEDPTGNHNYEEIAKAYKEMGDIDSSIDYYKRYIEDCDDVCDIDIYTELSLLYESKRDFENSAVYLLKGARQESEQSLWLWVNAARAMVLEGKKTEAKKYLEVSLQISPTDADAHYMMGQIYQENNDHYRALHHYTQALKTKPEFPEVYNNLGSLSFNEEGDIKAAIDYMQQALTMNPNTQLRTGLYLNLARLHNQIAEYDLHEYYKAKMMESIGFDVEYGDEDEEGEEEDEDGLV